jgi:YVTN family beta-propeller protein
VEPSGRYAYVTNLYGDSLAVVDLANRQVAATVPTGASPNGVSFSPRAPAPAAEPEIALALPIHEEMGEAGEMEGHAEHH